MTALSQSFNTETASPSRQEIETFLDAARRGDLETISLMLDAYGESIIEAKDSSGNCALITAAWNGYAEIVAALLDKNANIEAKNNDGNTALMWAAGNGHTKAVTILLDKGADSEAKDNNGDTALIMAVRRGHTDVVSALLDKDANIEAKNNNGTTALIAAAAEGQTEVVFALLDKNANIEAKNNNGTTALIAATRSGHAEIEMLLSQWPEKQRQLAEQRAQKLAAEVASLHTGIHQEVKVGSRLILQAPVMRGKP